MMSRRVTRTLTIFIVVFALLAGAAAAFYFGYVYVIAQSGRMDLLEAEMAARPDGELIAPDNPEAIEVIIPRAADTKQIAELLVEQKLIKNALMFQILSKFNGFDGRYVAGTHYLTAWMNYDEIMFALSQRPLTVRVTFPEGSSYRKVKQLLRAKNVRFNEAVLDSLMKNPQPFIDYSFVQTLPQDPNREFALEGYLYPDTYEFDINASEETIIRTFLNNTANHLPDEYRERARKIGMSLDEVITLASIIQSECAHIDEMITVSGVFHKRLKESDTYRLESCATVNHLRERINLPPVYWLSSAQINQFRDSRYNTYLYGGLPPGAINSPGDDAIRAALYPENNPYYFFAADGQGRNDFSRTQEEQDRKVRAYQEASARPSPTAPQTTTTRR